MMTWVGMIEPPDGAIENPRRDRKVDGAYDDAIEKSTALL
jgi:hypothetical protein